MTQVYEWWNILFIIIIQKKDSLGEIMYKLNNHETIIQFRKNQYIHLRIYQVLLMLMIFGKVIGYCFLIINGSNYIDLSPKLQPAYTILVFDELTPVVLLIIIFVVLMCYLRRFHYFEFKKNRIGIMYFFCLEVSIMILL